MAWAIGGLAVAWVAVLWSNPLNAPTLWPDSTSYLEFESHRTAGYPLFLAAVTVVFGAVEAAAGVQLVLAAAAYAFLAWSVHRALGAPWVALLLALALFAQPALARFHPSVLTESVFVSLLALLLGLLVRFVARPTPGCAVTAAVVCGLAAAVRPVGHALLPVWPVLAWLVWDRGAVRRGRLAAGVLAALAVCGAAERLAWSARHDAPRQSVLNRHLFGRALVLETPALAAPADELGGALAGFRAELAPGRRAIARAPAGRIRLLLQTRVEVAAPIRPFRPDVAVLARRRGISSNRMGGVLGWRGVAAAPGAWVRHGVAHYVGLWSMYEFLTPADARRHAVHAARLAAVLPRGMTIRIDRAPHSLAWPVRVVMAAAFMATIAAIGLAVRQAVRTGAAGLDAGLALAAVAGVIIHANYLATALFGVASARYAIAMWPAQVLCGLLLLRYLWPRLRAAAARGLEGRIR